MIEALANSMLLIILQYEIVSKQQNYTRLYVNYISIEKLYLEDFPMHSFAYYIKYKYKYILKYLLVWILMGLDCIYHFKVCLFLQLNIYLYHENFSSIHSFIQKILIPVT